MSDIETYASLVEDARKRVRQALEELAEYAEKLARAAEAEGSKFR